MVPEGQTVSTVGIRSLLVTYAWPENSVRYNKIAKFVHEFFGKIDQFHDGSRHPKWEEISLAAEMPGWTRFKPAADWLAEQRLAAARQHAPGVTTEGGSDLKLAFDQFIDQYAGAKGLKTISAGEQEMLFAKFRQYLQSQNSIAARSR